MVQIKRAYEEPTPEDGQRFLVDRLWPRGRSKEHLQLDGWLKNIAPSEELGRSFCHDPAHWEEFQRRYKQELKENQEAVQPLLEAARHGKITLVYGAKDTEHNQAVVFKDYLLRELRAES